MSPAPTNAQQRILLSIALGNIRRINRFLTDASDRAEQLFQVIEKPGITKRPHGFEDRLEQIFSDCYVLAMSLNQVYDVLKHLSIELPAAAKELKKQYLENFENELLKVMRDLYEHPVQYVLDLKRAAHKDRIRFDQPAIGFGQSPRGKISGLSAFGVSFEIEVATELAVQLHDPLSQYLHELPLDG